MKRKTALALLSAGVVVAAVLAPTTAMGQGRPCADIISGGGSGNGYVPSPLPLDNDGTLTTFQLGLTAPLCEDLTYTMYVMDDKSDLARGSKGEPVVQAAFPPLATLTEETPGFQSNGNDDTAFYYSYPEFAVEDKDPEPEQDQKICVFHTVTNAAGHVFDYGQPGTELCEELPYSQHPPGTAYR